MRRVSSHRERSHDERRQAGSSFVELAIVVPLVACVVFGVVELTNAASRQHGLQAAARDGARVAVQPDSTAAAVTTRVRTALDGVLAPSEIRRVTVTITPNQDRPCDRAVPGTPVVVTVTAPGQLAIPLVADHSLTLTGRGESSCA